MGSTKLFKISVLIPTKNRAAALREAFNALAAQTYSHFEVIVVDGYSTDGTHKVVEEYSDKFTILFSSQDGGLVRAENKGLQMATGDIVVRTDDDAVADSHWLETINQTFNLAQDIGGCTGPTVIPKDHLELRDIFSFQKRFTSRSLLWRVIGQFYNGYLLEGRPFAVSRWFRSGAFSLGSNFDEFTSIPGPIEVDHHESCNMAVRRDLLKAIGGFDPSYIGIGDYNEADVSFKIRSLGYRIVFHPGARVAHLPSKAGIFAERRAAYSRMLNFVNFYFAHIKPNSWDKLTRFVAYLAFQNVYYTYKFFTTGQFNQLGAYLGTIVGLAKNVFRLSSWRGGMFQD